MERFSIDDELTYVTEEWLKEQSELFYLQISKNSKVTINCELRKSVIMLKNKRMLIHLSFI